MRYSIDDISCAVGECLEIGGLGRVGARSTLGY